MTEANSQIKQYFLDTFIADSHVRHDVYIKSGTVFGKPQEVGGCGERCI
jgi:hypothetical protein